MGEMIDLSEAPFDGAVHALRSDFIEEAAEKINQAEALLLASDDGLPCEERVNAVFCAVHSIKGGAAAFGLSEITELAHAMETLLDALRRRTQPWQPEAIDSLLCSLDGLRDLLSLRGGGRGEVGDGSALSASLNRLAGVGEPASPTMGQHVLRLTLGPMVGEDAVEGVRALFRDIASLGDIEPVDDGETSPSGHRNFKIVSSASMGELLDLFSLYLGADQVVLVPWSEAKSARVASVEPPPVDAGDGHARGTAQLSAVASSKPTLRVSVAKLDHLQDLVDELAATESLLLQQIQELDGAHCLPLVAGVKQVDRIARQLRQSVITIRKIPMAVVFGRFPRMMRDLGTRLGKQLHLQTEGDLIELDRLLVEKLVDPLTHLVRNSADHGIEAPAQRVAAGKSRQGTIRLAASLQDESILIEIADDGMGLSRRRILDKARRQHLPVRDDMTDQEVWSLVWDPGFSTAETVTDVSGRGYGMDVVRRNIVELGGTVDLWSMEGQGTRVSIRLPLSID